MRNLVQIRMVKSCLPKEKGKGYTDPMTNYYGSKEIKGLLSQIKSLKFQNNLYNHDSI